jgi:hypothetical protein
MTMLDARTALEVLAIVLCPAAAFGEEEDAGEVMKLVKEAIIKRYQVGLRC